MWNCIRKLQNLQVKVSLKNNLMLERTSDTSNKYIEIDKLFFELLLSSKKMLIYPFYQIIKSILVVLQV